MMELASGTGEERAPAIMRRRVARAAWVLFGLQIGAFLLLRSQEQPSLDFVQMLLVAFLLYYDFLFLRAVEAGPHSLDVMEQVTTNAVNFILAGAFLARSYWGRGSLVRSLSRRMAVYFVVYAFAASVGDYALTFIKTNSGSWTSLAWTVPFLV